MRKETKIKNNFRLQVSDFRLQKGFTLIEMLAVIFIISLLSTLLIANYRRSQKQYALEHAAQKLVSDLRRVQAMAMSGEVIYTKQYFNYGLHVRKGQDYYVIYSDTTTKSPDCKYKPQGPSDIDDDTLETIYLPHNVEITNIRIPPDDRTQQRLHICFTPPDPTSNFIAQKANSFLENLSWAEIELNYVGESLIKKITITQSGAIKAE